MYKMSSIESKTSNIVNNNNNNNNLRLLNKVMISFKKMCS